MKTSDKGPFAQIRWFCNDGSVLPPAPYACVPHGGGRQHGEWNEQVKKLRDAGFYIANVMARIDADEFVTTDQQYQYLKQILLERFLIEIDDGWIFRGARFYRGALQVEDENRSGRSLLQALLASPRPVKQSYLLLREAVRYIPHGQSSPSVSEVRHLSTVLSEQDSNFMYLRNKIHSQPDLHDAQRVRDYAKRNKIKQANKYEQLALAIENLYRDQDIEQHLLALAKTLKDRALARQLSGLARGLSSKVHHEQHFANSAQLLMLLRDHFTRGAVPGNLDAFDTSLMLELANFTSGNHILNSLPAASRKTRLQWLADSSTALYGCGLISKRQQQAIQHSLERLHKPNLGLPVYREELRFLSRVPSWSNRWMQFHFAESIQHFAQIEPEIHRFVHDKLREGPLLVYSRVLDSLMQDANQQAGLSHQLFGRQIGSGLRALNPGLARGILRIPDSSTRYQADGIYLLPNTLAELPPVAGILTLGEGNALSHIQILANNLGIPNVVVDHALIPRIKRWDNQAVVLAVSPSGSVQLDKDGSHWDNIFQRETSIPRTRIKPDLNKLDLGFKKLVSLTQLRAKDAGRIVGPKAANLGELGYHFPSAVAEGLAIPFGVFRELLDREMKPGQTVFQWMKQQYRYLDSLAANPQSQQQATQTFLKTLRDWITHADAGEAFREQLKHAMQQVFGEDGSYAVFVRSDTNIEDLPGFTGAGLNLTVPNVVGFEKVLDAIARVWASPFTSRAYAWRQQRMEQPEHVYSSVLLMRTVPVDKSGVMVTMDVENGRHSWYSVAVNEGIGGAVHGQSAEELRINIYTGEVRLLSEATASYRRIATVQGGLQKVPATNNNAVLTDDQIRQLRLLGTEIPQRMRLLNDQNQLAPLDVEFGFVNNKLMLFQVRPYLQSRRAKRSHYLNLLDQNLTATSEQVINLDEIPQQ